MMGEGLSQSKKVAAPAGGNMDTTTDTVQTMGPKAEPGALAGFRDITH